MPNRHRSYIRRRGGRPNRRKPGCKSLRGQGGLQFFLLVRSDREANNSTGRSKCELASPEKGFPPGSDGGVVGSAETFRTGRRLVPPMKDLGASSRWAPRGLRGRHAEKDHHRKLGTTCGSPRRSRTAKASRISRHAVKSRCACEWGGWGRLSDDGPGHYNPDRSEGPWGRAAKAAQMAVSNRATCPTLSGKPGLTTEDTNDECKPAGATGMPGAGLTAATDWEGTAGNASLAAVLGKTRRTEC
jgi:hypothetical protein